MVLVQADRPMGQCECRSDVGTTLSAGAAAFRASAAASTRRGGSGGGSTSRKKPEPRGSTRCPSRGPGRGAPTQARKGPGRPGWFWPWDGGTLSTHSTLGTWVLGCRVSFHNFGMIPKILHEPWECFGLVDRLYTFNTHGVGSTPLGNRIFRMNCIVCGTPQVSAAE